MVGDILASLIACTNGIALQPLTNLRRGKYENRVSFRYHTIICYIKSPDAHENIKKWTW